MSLPAMTNQSASHRGIANQIDTTTRFCNAQVIKTCREPDRCVTGRLGHEGVGAVRHAPPCVVSRVLFYVLHTSSACARAVRRTRPAECTLSFADVLAENRRPQSLPAHEKLQHSTPHLAKRFANSATLNNAGTSAHDGVEQPGTSLAHLARCCCSLGSLAPGLAVGNRRHS